jgi:hypothetical protein
VLPFNYILGLGFRPMPPESNVESTLIWYKANEQNYKYWTDELDKFLAGKQCYLYCTIHFILCNRTKVSSLLSHWAAFHEYCSCLTNCCKNLYTRLHENLTDILVTDSRAQTDEQMGRHNHYMCSLLLHKKHLSNVKNYKTYCTKFVCWVTATHFSDLQLLLKHIQRNLIQCTIV